MLILFFLFDFLSICIFAHNVNPLLPEVELYELTRNLIENLRVDPFLGGESTSQKLSQTRKEFIDHHIERYSELVLTPRKKEFSRSKRSLEESKKEKEAGSDYGIDFNHFGNISAFAASDLAFYTQNSQLYAVSIGTKLIIQENVHFLQILRYQDKKLNVIKERKIENGVRLATFTIDNSTVIIVAENTTNLISTNIYEFTPEEELNVIQKITGSWYHDVRIWEDNGNVFMSLVGFMANSPVSSSSRLFKWRGRHFDVLQNIKDKGVTRITPFQIKDDGFLAVARNLPRDREENIYSEILKYNIETNKYEPFQNILTYACEDIKYFEIDGMEADTEKERFLIFANFNEKDSPEKINYQALSIIYRYIDNYFIPFQSIAVNGVKQWETIKNKNGDILLVALTKNGLRTFQYDGWLFSESKINFKDDFKNNEMQDIKAIHSYYIENKNLLGIARENPSKKDYLLYEIGFSKGYKLRKMLNKMLTWCQDAIKTINEKEVNILGEGRRGDMDEDLESESQTQSTEDKLTSTINKYNTKLLKISENLNRSLQSLDRHTIKLDLRADRIHINSTGYFETISTEKLNQKVIDPILKNVLNINEGFQIDSEVKIDFLRAEDLELKNLNGHSVETILHKNNSANVKKVKIMGSVTFKEDVSIGNINDNVKINSDTILLKNGDQNLGSLRVSEVKAEEVHTTFLNGHPVGSIQGEGSETLENEKVTSVKALKAKNLIVGGFLNDVDVPTLEKYALRKSGKQDITAETYYFDRVESELLDTDRLSGFNIPQDLILVNEGNYEISKSIMFKNGLTVNNLTALMHLDSIKVTRKHLLDLLYKDVKFEQHITGVKNFKNVEILNLINVRGKIKGDDFESINPFKEIETDLNITNDVFINGKVVIEDSVKSVDIISKKSDIPHEITNPMTLPLNNTNLLNVSIKNTTEFSQDISEAADKVVDKIFKGNGLKSVVRAVEHGIKLVDENINIPIKFLEHVTVTEVNTQSVNNMDPDDWVITGAKNSELIKGLKTFKGDLEVTGNTKVFQINNINTEEFENNILKKDGDQVITGNHEVKNVIVLEKLKTRNSKLGTRHWKNVLTTSDQAVDGNLTVSDFLAHSISVKSLTTKGKINELAFSEIMEDAFLKEQPLKMFGTKNLKNVNVNHLWVKNNFNMKKREQETEEKDLVLKNINNLRNVIINNVYFNNKLNGIDSTKFQIPTTNLENGRIQIKDDREFKEIVVFGNVFLESNRLNHVSLDDIAKNSVKTNQPEFLSDVEFGAIHIPTLIKHNGQIEKLDLDNVFENNKGENQNILDKIHFREGLSVTGTTNIQGRINEVKVNDLCSITSGIQVNKKLIIHGNVVFAKGPHIAQLNGMDVKEINENIWFTDRQATFERKATLSGNVTMREDTILQGLLNDVSIEHLSTKYLSKTKDQKIFAHINVSNTTFFLKDLTTPNISVGNLVNNMDLKKFLGNVLLHRPQLFEETVFFEDVTTNDLEGNYLVNKLNLNSEVMRYDRPNLITGPKSFGNLDVDVLRPEREGLMVQEVDVGQWIERAVLKEGDYKIAGNKKFVNVEIKESTNLIGLLNNITFNKDYVLLRNTPQEIREEKLFISSDKLTFKALKIKGLLNGDEFPKILEYQANRNEENYINSSLTFFNNITATNINFQKEYYGVNVSDLLKNISTIGTLQHIKEKYVNLVDMTNEVEKSLKSQAFFLDYFKQVPPSFDFTEMFSVNCGNKDKSIISFKNDNGSNILKFLEWDEKQGVFNESYSKNLGLYPDYINKIKIDGNDAIYIEHFNKSTNEDYTHLGQLMSCQNTSTNLFGNFQTKGTIFLTSFQINSKKLQCMLFIDFNFDINILCHEPDKVFKLQAINNKNATMASVAMVEDQAYLVTIHKGAGKKTVIWKLKPDNLFNIYKTYSEGDPISVTTLSSKKGTFLAVAYKHLPNTVDFGKIVIRKFDQSTQTFLLYQTIKIKLPTQILFSELPSKEIALYVTTQNPSEPFIAYLYEGVSGFVIKIEASAIPKAVDVKDLTIKNQHFVVVKHVNDTSVVQGVFKGSKL